MEKKLNKNTKQMFYYESDSLAQIIVQWPPCPQVLNVDFVMRAHKAVEFLAADFVMSKNTDIYN